MAEELTTLNLVKHYLNIANAALHQAEHHSWGRAVVAVLDQIASGTDILLQVVDAQGAPLGRYATYYQHGQFAPPRDELPATGASFTLTRAFLEDVWAHAEEYMNHPMKLDWRWLTSDRGAPPSAPPDAKP